MESSGYLISATTEFASGVQITHNHFKSGFLFGRVHAHGNTPAIITDAYGTVRVNGYPDAFTEARHRFIDGIIDNFPNQMMQATRGCITDIHARALADRVQSLQRLYGGFVVSL